MTQETKQETKTAGMDVLTALMAAKFDEYVPRIPELKEGNKELIDGLVKAYGVLPDSPFTVMVTGYIMGINAGLDFYEILNKAEANKRAAQ